MNFGIAGCILAALALGCARPRPEQAAGPTAKVEPQAQSPTNSSASDLLPAPRKYVYLVTEGGDRATEQQHVEEVFAVGDAVCRLQANTCLTVREGVLWGRAALPTASGAEPDEAWERWWPDKLAAGEVLRGEGWEVRIIDRAASVDTAAGTFHGCVHFRFIDLEFRDGSNEEWWCPGYGRVREDVFTPNRRTLRTLALPPAPGPTASPEATRVVEGYWQALRSGNVDKAATHLSVECQRHLLEILQHARTAPPETLHSLPLDVQLLVLSLRAHPALRKNPPTSIAGLLATAWSPLAASETQTWKFHVTRIVRGEADGAIYIDGEPGLFAGGLALLEGTEWKVDTRALERVWLQEIREKLGMSEPAAVRRRFIADLSSDADLLVPLESALRVP